MSSGWCGWVHICCKYNLVSFHHLVLFHVFSVQLPFHALSIFWFLGGSWKNTNAYLVNDLTDLKTGLVGLKTLHLQYRLPCLITDALYNGLCLISSHVVTYIFCEISRVIMFGDGGAYLSSFIKVYQVFQVLKRGMNKAHG